MKNIGSASPIPALLAAARSCILVVEDDWMIRMLLSDELRDEGYQVIEACDGDEAIALLATKQPDLIISDVRMPGSLDGLGLLGSVKHTYPTIPVIISSAHLAAEEALAKGAANYVAKPYTMPVMIEAVQTALATSP